MALQQSRSFGDLLREYRRAADMTQEKLAERARLSVRALRKLESGVSHAPHLYTVANLATALGLSVDDRTRLERSASLHRLPRLRVSAATMSTGQLSSIQGRESLDTLGIALVGRGAELAWLEGHVRGLGQPLLLLAGEPGIGKSRLLREAVVRAHEHGLTVLEGGCHRRSGQEPYAPLIAALASYAHSQSTAQLRRALEGCAWLVRLLPELADATLVPAPSWTLPLA